MSASASLFLSMIPESLDAAHAVALARALLAALDDERHLDPDVKRVGRRLRDASEALRVAWEAAVRAAIAADHGVSARHADKDEDAVWLALYTFIKGWSLLPAGLATEGESARALLLALFPDDAGFTGLPYAQEWAEADRVLATMDADGLAPTIEALGGAPLLRALRAAHERYERVLGIRDAAVDAPMTQALAPLVTDFLATLRAYVAATEAATAGEAPARAERLLAPLRRWTAERARPTPAAQPRSNGQA